MNRDRRAADDADAGAVPSADASDSIQDPTADQPTEFSLELLGKFYAQAVSRQKRGQAATDRQSNEDGDVTDDLTLDAPASATRVESNADQPTSADQPTELVAEQTELTPQSILEAMLFVGTPDNQPLTARKAASLIRGVSPNEIDGIVDQLNSMYRENRAAYTIAKKDQGYRMVLCDDLRDIRTRFYGRQRPARLSQAAIEVLAVVAYHQPATSEDVDRLRNRHSGPILNQLVRRDLLAVERDPAAKRIRKYSTTDRFLALFGLDSIDDLPQADIDDEFDLP